MKKITPFLLVVLVALASCKSWNKTQKGAAIGTTGGAAAGAIIGRASGNTALGAIIGATVGGAAGVIIGKKMDKQAEEIKKKVPDAKVERVGEGIIVEFNSKILFGFDSYALTPAAKANLDKLKTVLTDFPDTDIEIQGHTDDTGTDSYNEKLSERRADAVKDYLKSKGIAKGRMNTVGYGEAAPAYDNNNEDNRSKNRRVEFLITANEQMKEAANKEAGN
jgi:outer membrane protein OmpA-like peptidoglycan-associated protein